MGNVVPGLLTSDWTRPAVAAVQVATFATVTIRLAGVVAHFGRGLSRAVVVGLLCTPFAVLTNGDVLSESVSLSITCLLVASACPTGLSRWRRNGNVVAVFVCLAMLAMTRTAHLPVALGASGAIVLLLLTGVALRGQPPRRRLPDPGQVLLLFTGVVRRGRSRRDVTLGLVMCGLGLVGWALVVAPQAVLMWKHEQLVPNDGALWGEGGKRLTWGQQVGKYTTVVVDCPEVPVAGVAYPMPFADGTTATGQLGWYLSRPHVAAWHLFQSLNWDFPTTYITTFNPLVTVTLNAVSLGVVVVGFASLAGVAPSLVRHLTAEAPVLGIVLAAIGGLWLQTAFTAVETRFGIIPWAALSVAAVWGAMRWWERLGRGTGGWRSVIYVALATGVLLVVSRMAVAGVPVFQQLEAAGCWR